MNLEINESTPLLNRSLNSRHITMIAIGGTVGTGLFIGVAQTLATGPVTALTAYIFIAAISYCVVQSFGEMSVHLPINGSLCQFNARFLSKSFGASIGILYWFSWSMTFALELSVVAQLIKHWDPYDLDIGIWIVFIWTLLTGINLLPIRFYGEIEFCISFIKVLAIVVWSIYACMVAFFAESAPRFKYWHEPGMWGDGILVDNKSMARFLSWVSSLVNAAFTFQSIESIAITSGDTRDPQRTLPKAIKTLFFRILFFYIFTLFLLGLLIPYNDPQLQRGVDNNNGQDYISSSPFVIALYGQAPKIAEIFHLVILVTIISAANSNIYLGSRSLLALAETSVVPKIFQKNYGITQIPYISVLTTSFFGILAFTVKFQQASQVFYWMLNICASAGLIMWACICFSHIRFMSAIELVHGFNRDDLFFKGAYMPYAAYFGLISISVILLFNGFPVFFNFQFSDFLASYLSLIIFGTLWLIYQLSSGSPLLIPLEEIDLFTGSTKLHLS